MPASNDLVWTRFVGSFTIEYGSSLQFVPPSPLRYFCPTYCTARLNTFAQLHRCQPHLTIVAFRSSLLAFVSGLAVAHDVRLCSGGKVNYPFLNSDRDTTCESLKVGIS
jgi:hypothetical protein